jgi:signal transduction histidine kinase/CheY-like chemotaxis protein
MKDRPIGAKATMIADQLHKLKDQILELWRREVRSSSEQAALVAHLDDQELQDHLPALTERIIALLRGAPVEGLEKDAEEHGQQRYRDGYSVVQLLREMQIFRQVLATMAYELVGPDESAQQIQACRNLIADAVDRSMNASIAQYSLMAEQQRLAAQGEARELHEQRDRFLVTLSHELRNQVSPILLGLQLLKALKPSDRRLEEVVARIERQARQQAILIDDLLDISRFRYGKLQLNRENLDLRIPLQHAIETFQGDFAAKQLKLEVQTPNERISASADEARVAQILINLLSNALKFTPSGGRIDMGLSKEAGAAVFNVSDTGIGITPAILPQLFTMFFQGGEPSSTVKPGLGVGLALAKILAEMHGGTIEGQSEGAGKGAAFTVRLPLMENMAQEELPPPATRVLVVDDNPDHLAVLAELLELHGYEVIKAQDAAEALRLATEHQPRACVIDIGLPDMDGYELARQLRVILQSRDSRLIAVTGYGTKGDRKAFEEAGFDHFFPKPPDIKELIRVLH